LQQLFAVLCQLVYFGFTGGMPRGLTLSVWMRFAQRSGRHDVYSPSALPGTAGRAEGSFWEV